MNIVPFSSMMSYDEITIRVDPRIPPPQVGRRAEVEVDPMIDKQNILRERTINIS